MAKTTLPTNYVDDVLNGAMDGKRRYREIPNADGTFSLEDATTYDQIGNNFGASQLNLMNDNINQSFDANKMLKTMDEVNAVTQEGYGVDALVVKELNSSFQWKLIGSATGTTPITLPSNFSEILVIVKMDDEFYNFNIPKLYLDETNKSFYHGKGLNFDAKYYLTQVRILISTNKVALRDARGSANASLTDYTSTTIITAYYR